VLRGKRKEKRRGEERERRGKWEVEKLLYNSSAKSQSLSSINEKR